MYVCSNYGNHCALTFSQRRHSAFPGSMSGVRTACPYLATFLIAHLLLSQSPMSCAHEVWLIYWSYNYSVIVMAEGWSTKATDSFYSFFILMALSGRVYKVVADILIFIYLVPDLKRKIAGKSQLKWTCYRSSVASSHFFCYTYLSEKKKKDRWTINTIGMHCF